MARKKPSENKVEVGNIREVSGEVNIAAGDIYKGYTAEQVSVLLTQITSTFQPKPFDGRCPYKGLDVFEEEDADLFFGRERLVNDLINRVKESRTVFITGPSGSGKSSLVRAGLIHALKQGVIKNLHSERWLYETMKPGREPLKELSLAFSRLKSPELANYFQAHVNEVDILNECAESVLSGSKTQRFVLFVDQFEEVFTQINKEEERLPFLNMLAHAGTVENGRVIVLFAMRSDFISNCAAYPMLNELLSKEFRQIGAMQPEELVAAIALPAKEVGLPVEDELIARIINDMDGEPGALPLMQFSLKDLFDSQEQQGGVIALTLKDYLQHGGIQKSLERHADASLAALDEEGQNLARSIFSGLIEIGRGTQDTKRTALFDELVPAQANSADVLAIVQRLADARLIITDEQAGKDTVTISHEKLIDAWPWLKKLVNENRDAIALQNEIASDAKEWEEHRRDASYLYTGARLANAREKLEARKLVLSGLAYEFVQMGRKRQKRSQITLIAGISGIIILLFLAVIVFSNQSIINANNASIAQAASTVAVAQQATAQSVSTLAVAQAEEARRQSNILRAGELAGLSLSHLADQIDLSSLLSVEAINHFDNHITRNSVLSSLQAMSSLVTFLHGHTSTVWSVAFSPNGKILASGSADSTIILWDVTNPYQPFQLNNPLHGHDSPIRSIAFSPDGKILASGSVDKTIVLWDVSNPNTPVQLANPLIGHSGTIRSISFMPNGKILASGGDDNSIILWDVVNPSAPTQLGNPLLGHEGAVRCISFSPDGKILASGSDDGRILLWDVSNPNSPVQFPNPPSHFGGGVRSLAFDSSGKILASSSEDSIIHLWDVSNPKMPIQLGNQLSGHEGVIRSVSFSPDGKILASGSDDGRILLWDVSIPDTPIKLGDPLLGHRYPVVSVVFNPNSKILASSSVDSTVIVWDVSHTISPLQIGAPLAEQSGDVQSIAFSLKGKIFASGSSDGTVVLWDKSKSVTPIRLSILPVNQQGILWNVAFSSNGKTLAVTNPDGSIILWDVSNPNMPIRRGTPLTGHKSTVRSIAFSPDGKTLASGGDDNTIILWDVSNPNMPIRLGAPLTGHKSTVRSIAFSPDGKTLASGGDDNTIILWDVSNPNMPIRLGAPLTGHKSTVRSIAFSPDGKTLASGGDDNTIILWDVSNPSATFQLGNPLFGHKSVVRSIAFDPRGQIMASGGDDNAIILWDVSNPHASSQLGLPLLGHTGAVLTVAFEPDGGTLVSGSADNTIRVWDVDPQSWVNINCQRAGRNFTQAEWEQYFPNEAYRITCPQWPAGE